jgi:ABC-type uncharacterized transport system auxiliary subunit
MMRPSHLSLLLALLLAGCFQRPAERRHYVLDYVPEASRERLQRGPWPVQLLIRNFEMGHAYQKQELVYRASAHEIGYHWNHLWAVRPERVVTDMARRHVEQVRLFRSVQNQYEENAPDYELRGRVLALEEIRHETGRWAHLELQLSLIRLADGVVLWDRTQDLRSKVAGEEPVFVVRGLSTLLEAAMDQTIASLDSTMAREVLRP